MTNDEQMKAQGELMYKMSVKERRKAALSLILGTPFITGLWLWVFIAFKVPGEIFPNLTQLFLTALYTYIITVYIKETRREYKAADEAMKFWQGNITAAQRRIELDKKEQK